MASTSASRVYCLALVFCLAGGCSESPDPASEEVIMANEDAGSDTEEDATGSPADTGERDDVDSSQNVDEPLFTATAEIGIEGGVINIAEVGTLTIPAGALSETTQVEVLVRDPHALTEIYTLGYVYEITPKNLELQVPALLALRFSNSLGQQLPGEVAILWGDRGTPLLALLGYADFEARMAYGEVTRFSEGGVVLFNTGTRVCCAVEEGVYSTTGSWCSEIDGEARPLDFCYTVCCTWDDAETPSVWSANATCIERGGTSEDPSTCLP